MALLSGDTKADTITKTGNTTSTKNLLKSQIATFGKTTMLSLKKSQKIGETYAYTEIFGKHHSQYLWPDRTPSSTKITSTRFLCLNRLHQLRQTI